MSFVSPFTLFLSFDPSRHGDGFDAQLLVVALWLNFGVYI